MWHGGRKCHLTKLQGAVTSGNGVRELPHLSSSSGLAPFPQAAPWGGTWGLQLWDTASSLGTKRTGALTLRSGLQARTLIPPTRALSQGRGLQAGPDPAQCWHPCRGWWKGRGPWGQGRGRGQAKDFMGGTERFPEARKSGLLGGDLPSLG